MKKYFTTIAMLLVLVLLLSIVSNPLEVSANSVKTYESQISKISSDLEKLKAEKAAIIANIAAVRGEKSKKIAVLNHLDDQIRLTQQDISLTEERIQLLFLSIDEKTQEIELKQLDYDTNRAIFLKRARAMYVYDKGNSVGMVLGTEKLSDKVLLPDMLERVAKYDQRLMDELEKERIALEVQQQELEETRVAVEADKEEAVALKAELASQRGTAAAAVQDISEMEKQYLAAKDENDQKSAAMKAEISNIYKKIELSKNPYIGGEMLWPVPGFSFISSHYGWRFGRSNYHTGMDIAGGGIHGAKVIAANGGTVAYTNWSHSPGRSYGIYIIVDHGGGRTTLYAHLSNIQVSTGQTVARGQTIGNVGTTGWSTGPHLHFEVREGSSHKNPYPYVTGGAS